MTHRTLNCASIMKIDYLKTVFHQKSIPSLGVYIHIPFCRVRCQFCAFYVQTYQNKKVQDFLEGLDREIHLYGEKIGFKGIPATSVYFGGGTPTVLSVQHLTQIFHSIQKWFAVSADAEISVEAHPAAVNFEDLKLLHSHGFNRISIGAQSFDDQELEKLGGRALSLATQKAVISARQAGFENISLDLMYGFPSHTCTSWHQTLKSAIALEPTHLSCYAFTVEEGSHFHDLVQKGLVGPNESLQSDLAKFTIDFLENSGFVRYEISNFSKPDFACKHNLRYWQGEDYLGFGPSAQSFVSGARFGNEADLDSYCSTLVQEELPIEQLEVLTHQKLIRERIIFGLRTAKGVPCERVRTLFRKDTKWAGEFNGLKEQGLLAEEEGYVLLTEKGIQFADTVAVALL